MSGGYFDYRDNDISTRLFGYRVETVYGIGEEKFYSRTPAQRGGYEHYSISRRDEYLKNLKMARKQDPFNNIFITEIVYDVLCLLHSFDYTECGDTGDDQFDDDVQAFLSKWLSPNITKEVVDGKLEQVREDIYKAIERK